MAQLINKIGWFFVKNTCTHEEEKLLRIHYQEDCIEWQCNKCHVVFWTDLS